MKILDFLKTILKTDNKKLGAQKDELIGRWQNYDDGSGLNTMIWQYGLDFFKNGDGISYHLENKKISKNLFLWKRIDYNTIEIKLAQDDEFETIKYIIQKVKCSYNSDCLEITETNKKEFWISHEPLYKY